MNLSHLRRCTTSRALSLFPFLCLLAAALRCAADQAIYDDGLRNGWLNWSWAAVDSNATRPGSSDAPVIRANAGAWESIWFQRESFALAGYQALQLRLHGGPDGGQRLHVLAVRNNSPVGTAIALPALRGDAWIIVTVPLATMGAPATIDGFWLQNRSDSALPVFYVDEVRLLSDYSSLAVDAIADPARRGAAADADGDGAPNLVEWGVGTDPAASGSRPLMEVLTVADEGGLLYPAIRYAQSTARAAVPLGVESSNYLIEWGTGPGHLAVTGEEVDLVGGLRRLVVRSTTPLAPGGREFFRLVVPAQASAAGPSALAPVFPAAENGVIVYQPPPPEEDLPLYPANSVKPIFGETVPGLPRVTGRIHVDQFGYRPELAKVAVISDPIEGYNAHEAYQPGELLEVRRKSDDAVVFSGPPKVWAGGATDADSGDRGWWFDFSALSTPGEYYVFDPSTQRRSPVFKIGADVYRDVLRAAMRMYFYQRLGVALEGPYAEAPWRDGPGFPQDAQARLVTAKTDASTARNLSGGWMDAGDTNKYPTFLAEVIHPLLYAWRAHPSVFGDDFGIPESSNGRSDLLDEVKFELDWLIKMQDSDGGVFIKMGNLDTNSAWPVSTDTRARYYGPKCSASTLWTAGIFAHAARVYSGLPGDQPFANELRTRALAAWDWYVANPRCYNCDTGEIKSGSANRTSDEHDRMEGFVAVHLWALTGETRFHDVVKQRADSSLQMKEWVWSAYEITTAEALLDYASLPGSDPTLVNRLRDKLRGSAANADWAPGPERSLYRSWMPASAYHWGSNMVRAGYGVGALLASELPGTTSTRRVELRQRAADLLHHFHGVNPLGVVFLTNMEGLGAESSVHRIWHDRYPYNSPLRDNPPPGYLVGGPNSTYLRDGPLGRAQYDWLREQPRAKCYADFNDPWPSNSWEISEPGIYYQAVYIRLLAALAAP
jgi:hypothetical protein